jgi:hypothetical protein
VIIEDFGVKVKKKTHKTKLFHEYFVRFGHKKAPADRQGL